MKLCDTLKTVSDDYTENNICWIYFADKVLVAVNLIFI